MRREKRVVTMRIKLHLSQDVYDIEVEEIVRYMGQMFCWIRHIY